MMKLFLLPLFAVAAVTSADRASFTTYTLGMDEAAFRAQLPAYEKPVRVVCNSDVKWLTPSDPNETVCSFEEQYSADGWYRHDLKLGGDVSATVDFAFYKAKLSRIDAYFDVTGSSIIGESLKTKFGAPTTTETKPLQVRSGATFPQTVTTWKVGSDLITMKVPDLTTQRMSVIYLDTKAAAALKAEHKPADIM